MIWKLLRKNISVVQFGGFFLANLIGLTVILAALQLYRDIVPIYGEPDSFMRNDYMILSKKVPTLSVLGIGNTEFSDKEISELDGQPFVKDVGRFTPAEYRIMGSVGMGDMYVSSYMFFEAVPDEFIDVKSSQWKFSPGSDIIPIIIPKNYLNLYNYGFAQSQGLPQISQDLFGVIEISLKLSGNGRTGNFKGRIAGFSNRLNTILVPQDFIDWSNEYFGPGERPAVSRLIIEVENSADERLHTYLSTKGYEIEGDKQDGGKAAYFMKIITAVVILIGLIITVLSFFILMLSIYLLLQKNTDKLRNLILLGYTPGQVARPYQLLTFGMNFGVLLFAFLLIIWFRSKYMPLFATLTPGYEGGGLIFTLLAGVIVALAVSLFNSFAVSRKVRSLWLSE